MNNALTHSLKPKPMPTTQGLNMCIIQADLHWEDIDANLSMFEEKIWRIGEAVDGIILPEMFNTGFTMKPEALAEVEGLKTHRWLLQMAAQKKALVGGSYMVKVGGQYFNRFVAALPDGSFHTYDKRHLFHYTQENRFFQPGTKRQIIPYKGWKICPLICYDLRFPTWSINHFDGLAYDYDLLIYVSSWPAARIQAWDILLKARAVENQSYTLGVNRVGKDGHGYAYPGHSAMYDYAGNALAALGEAEGTATRYLEKKTARRVSPTLCLSCAMGWRIGSRLPMGCEGWTN